jgi:hypothetical protein
MSGELFLIILSLRVFLKLLHDLTNTPKENCVLVIM